MQQDVASATAPSGVVGSARELEAELAHLEKSLRSTGERLVIEPASCRSCGYEFEVRRARRFHAPRRCPKCKRERVAPPRARIG